MALSVRGRTLDIRDNFAREEIANFENFLARESQDVQKSRLKIGTRAISN